MARKPLAGSYRQQFIAAIEELFPEAWFSRFSSHGNGTWTAQKVFWMSIVMSWQPAATLTGQFEASRDLLWRVFPRWKLGRSCSGFLAARQRLLPEMEGPLRLRLQLFVTASFESWRVRGWSLFAVDGSRFESPRTTPNERRLGCAGKELTTPQVFQTTLQHVGTGLPWDVRLGPGTDSERRHLDDMRANLPSRAMLTADAGFISFSLCRWLIGQGHFFLLRVGANVRLLTGLGWDVEVEGRTVYLWPQTQRHLPPVVLRLIVVRRDGQQPVYLATNIHDERRLTDDDAAELYRLRWGIELYYRSFKQTLGHKTPHSRTPHMVLAEQTWHVLATWLLHLLTARELIAAGQSPASWSCVCPVPADLPDRGRWAKLSAIGVTFNQTTRQGRETVEMRYHPQPKAVRPALRGSGAEPLEHREPVALATGRDVRRRPIPPPGGTRGDELQLGPPGGAAPL